jgi:phosphotransferase system  glucose/maltose/N-acetylglucosamine-specific IIC component
MRHDFRDMWIIVRQDLPIQKVTIGIIIIILYYIYFFVFSFLFLNMDCASLGENSPLSQ